MFGMSSLPRSELVKPISGSMLCSGLADMSLIAEQSILDDEEGEVVTPAFTATPLEPGESKSDNSN